MKFNHGDQVMLDPEQTTSDYRAEQTGGTYNMRYATLRQGEAGVITRPNTNNSMVRINDSATIWVPNIYLRLVGTSAGTRRRGTPPEGMIAPDDPRLAWLWDDISDYANRSDYCGVFDNILRDLSLPPRKREFTAHGNLDGLQITAQIMAKNQAEANNQLAERIAARIREEATA